MLPDITRPFDLLSAFRFSVEAGTEAIGVTSVTSTPEGWLILRAAYKLRDGQMMPSLFDQLQFVGELTITMFHREDPKVRYKLAVSDLVDMPFDLDAMDSNFATDGAAFKRVKVTKREML